MTIIQLLDNFCTTLEKQLVSVFYGFLVSPKIETANLGAFLLFIMDRYPNILDTLSNYWNRLELVG